LAGAVGDVVEQAAARVKISAVLASFASRCDGAGKCGIEAWTGVMSVNATKRRGVAR